MQRTLNSGQVERASGLLLEARLGGRTIPAIPEDCRPATLADAYAVQARLVERLGRGVAGWFCACTNREIQEMLGLDGPYYGRLLEGVVLPGPATLRAAALPPLCLECEFAFSLARDLPAAGAPYGRDEVAAAVAAVHPAIEVVAGYLDDWPSQDVFSVIADNGTDGRLVHGAGVAAWRDIELATVAVSLTVNGRREREGAGANVLGDPLTALVWLANARAAAGEGLVSGQIHNTGTATPIYWAGAGDAATADFGPFGSVSLSVT